MEFYHLLNEIILRKRISDMDIVNNITHLQQSVISRVVIRFL